VSAPAGALTVRLRRRPARPRLADAALAGVLVLLLVIAVAGPVLAPQDPDSVDLSAAFAGPGPVICSAPTPRAATSCRACSPVRRRACSHRSS
jgi:hypothetical protein